MSKEFKPTVELIWEFLKWVNPNQIDNFLESNESIPNQSHIPKDFSLEERKVFTSDMGLSVKSPHPIVGAVHTQEAPPVEKPKRDWEIVSNYFKECNYIHEPNEHCEENECTIHSVRRLSDNTVFSVGDEVGYVGINGKKYNDIINKIQLLKDEGVEKMCLCDKGCGVILLSEAIPTTPTPPPKERIRVLGFCYMGESKKPILSSQTFYEYSFCTTKIIDPSLGLINVIEKAINQ